jgi:hypothetical protein
MNIRFTSSLTPEDENVVAPALIAAISNLLSLVPISYVIRIDTSDSQVYQHAAGPGDRAPSDSTVPNGLPTRAGAY